LDIFAQIACFYKDIILKVCPVKLENLTIKFLKNM